MKNQKVEKITKKRDRASANKEVLMEVLAEIERRKGKPDVSLSLVKK